MNSSTARLCVVMAAVFVALCSAASRAADSESLPRVQLNTKNATPRTVEELTEKALLRDYASSWRNLAEAYESASTAPLDPYFVDSARSGLGAAITGEAKTGVRSRYLEQQHDVQAVFYAPEGDAIELHDTMTCQIQIVDGGKVLHEEQAKLHYVVILTPAADRWVIRQLQAVPHF